MVAATEDAKHRTQKASKPADNALHERLVVGLKRETVGSWTRAPLMMP
jgi:hypothetical protein